MTSFFLHVRGREPLCYELQSVLPLMPNAKGVELCHPQHSVFTLGGHSDDRVHL